MKEMYIDEYGELWTRTDEYYVQRVSDGNIGTWQNGRGLEKV